MNKKSIHRFAAFALLFVPGFAVGADVGAPRVLRSADVVTLLSQRNAELKAALLNAQRAGVDATAEEGLRPFVLQLDGGYTRSSMAMTNATGDVSFANGNEIGLGSQLTKTTSIGTRAAVRIEGNIAPNDPTSVGMGAKLSLEQPLLRGAGRRVNEASWRLALKAENVAKLTAKKRASALAQEALVAYWELWYAAHALEIDREAFQNAVSVLSETRARIEKGAAAEVDAYQFETNAARLEEVVVATSAAKQRTAVQLGLLVGIPGDATPLESDGVEEPIGELLTSAAQSREALLQAALADSPEVRESAARVAQAEEAARVAGESMRQRLDLIGWIGAQTLAVGEVAPAFEQFGMGAAYAGYVGLEYEIPLGDTRKKAQRASAQLAVEIARADLEAVGARVRAETLIATSAVDNAKSKLALAEKTFGAAQKQAEAERQRYALGASIYLVVRDAEETARQAELRVVRAKVDLIEAQIKLDHLTGVLLRRMGEPKL